MACAALRKAVFVAGLLFLVGCLPDDMPAYINDGKTIVAKANGALWTYDVATGKATSHRLRDAGGVRSARMIGDQIWTQWGPDGNGIVRSFDPLKGEFLEHKEAWVYEAIPASYEGQKCVVRPPDARGRTRYSFYTFPELKELETGVNVKEVVAAGGFRWVAITVAADRAGSLELGQVEVFSQEGKHVVTVQHDEAQKMKFTGGRGDFRTTQGGRVNYARLNDDEKVLLLAFGNRGHFTFGVFDTTDGKFLWGGRTECPLRGNPVVKRAEAWSLEGANGEEIALIRHTAGDKPAEGKRETVLKYAGMYGEYNSSPDGSMFVIARDGQPPRLLFIPIREGVTANDVKVVELTNQESTPR